MRKEVAAMTRATSSCPTYNLLVNQGVKTDSGLLKHLSFIHRTARITGRMPENYRVNSSSPESGIPMMGDVMSKIYVQLDTIVEKLGNQLRAERDHHEELRPEIFKECQGTIMQVFNRIIGVVEQTHPLSKYDIEGYYRRISNTY